MQTLSLPQQASGPAFPLGKDKLYHIPFWLLYNYLWWVVALGNPRIVHFSTDHHHHHSAKDINPYSGIGLKNVQRRLDLVYEGQYELEKEQNVNSFDVRLRLQLSEFEVAQQLMQQIRTSNT